MLLQAVSISLRNSASLAGEKADKYLVSVFINLLKRLHRAGMGSFSKSVLPDGKMKDHFAGTVPRVHIWPRAAAALVCAFACGLLMLRMFDVGIEKGMPGSLSESISNPPRAIAIAISDMKYHLNKGYVGYRVIYNALEQGGMTNSAPILAALGKAYPANLRDSQLLNSAIASALSVTPPDNASFKDNSLMRIDEADPGLVDYYKIAFRIFGFNTESFFYLYFVLLSISVVIFLLAYYRSAVLMVVPVLFLTAGNIVLSSDLFSEVQIQLITVANLRFLSTLGLLPALHLTLLMLEREQITLLRGSLAVAQIALLVFVFSIRSTISWVLPLFFAIAATQLTRDIRRLKRQDVSLARAFHASAKALLLTGWWPLAALLAVLFMFQTLMSMRMHPSYQLDDALPHHYRVNNAFIGLTAHPRWEQTFAKDYGFAIGDELGLRAGVNYFVTHYDQPETLYRSPLTGEVKSGLHERMVRGAYFAFIRQHPWFVVEAHVAKTKRLFVMLWHYFTQSLISQPVSIVVLLATLITGIVAAREGPSILRYMRQIAIMCGAAIPFSWLIVLGDPRSYLIGDQLWMVSFGFMIACWALLTFMLLRCSMARLKLGRGRDL